MLSPEERLSNAGAQILELKSDHKSSNSDINKLEFQLTIASTLAGKPVPRRPFVVPGWIPRRQVTLLSGNGGIGKSLIALQLMVAASRGATWLGLPVAEPLRSLGLFAEDDEDEMHARLNDIAALECFDIGELDNLAWRSAVIDPCELVEINQRGKIQKTPYFDWLEHSIKDFGARLVVLDAAANLFGADEINRRQVSGFLAMLRHIAVDIDGAIVLLAHPSIQGMQSGSGLSGSTGWNNAVRSRLYLEPDTYEEPDKDVRELSKKKANYSSIGGTLRIRWMQGAFTAMDAPTSLDKAAEGAKADRVFLALLASTYEIGAWVSATPTSRNNAAKVFSLHPDREGLSKESFARAMNQLLKTCKIEVEKYDRPSAPRYRLRVKS